MYAEFAFLFIAPSLSSEQGFCAEGNDPFTCHSLEVFLQFIFVVSVPDIESPFTRITRFLSVGFRCVVVGIAVALCGFQVSRILRTTMTFVKIIDAITFACRKSCSKF